MISFTQWPASCKT